MDKESAIYAALYDSYRTSSLSSGCRPQFSERIMFVRMRQTGFKISFAALRDLPPEDLLVFLFLCSLHRMPSDAEVVGLAPDAAARNEFERRCADYFFKQKDFFYQGFSFEEYPHQVLKYWHMRLRHFRRLKSRLRNWSGRR